MKQYELAVGLREEGNVADAYRALHRALELDPNNAYAHLLIAKMFLLSRAESTAENDKKAEEHYLRVVRLGTEPERPRHDLVVEAQNDLGVLYIHRERYADAIRQLSAAANNLFNRHAHFAWGNLGWAYYLAADYDSALTALSRAVKLHRHFCVGYFRLGKTYVAKGDHQRAEEAFTHALQADERCRHFQEAWHLRGESRAHLKHRKDAIGDFERCVELGAYTAAGQACSRYLEASH
ncbi:MAG: tetratricopeptide repeat protein [Proteobacteria bacterium]|nr:tetratricopeptide repeat protein [Pseudomonadota bacterium]